MPAPFGFRYDEGVKYKYNLLDRVRFYLTTYDYLYEAIVVQRSTDGRRNAYTLQSKEGLSKESREWSIGMHEEEIQLCVGCLSIEEGLLETVESIREAALRALQSRSSDVICSV